MLRLPELLAVAGLPDLTGARVEDERLGVGVRRGGADLVATGAGGELGGTEPGEGGEAEGETEDEAAGFRTHDATPVKDDGTRLSGGRASLKAVAEAVLCRAEAYCGEEPLAEVRGFVAVLVRATAGWERAAKYAERHAEAIRDAAVVQANITAAEMRKFEQPKGEADGE